MDQQWNNVFQNINSRYMDFTILQRFCISFLIYFELFELCINLAIISKFKLPKKIVPPIFLLRTNSTATLSQVVTRPVQ